MVQAALQAARGRWRPDGLEQAQSGRVEPAQGRVRGGGIDRPRRGGGARARSPERQLAYNGASLSCRLAPQGPRRLLDGPRHTAYNKHDTGWAKGAPSKYHTTPPSNFNARGGAGSHTGQATRSICSQRHARGYLKRTQKVPPSLPHTQTETVRHTHLFTSLLRPRHPV